MLLSLDWPRLGLGNPLRPLRRLYRRWVEMREAVAGRRAIAAMDARMLADIGLSPSEAAEEINRKPWDTSPILKRVNTTKTARASGPAAC